MILNKIIFTFALLAIGVASIKIGTFYFIARIRQNQYEKVKGNYKSSNHKTNKHFNIATTTLSKESSLPMTYLKYYCLNNSAPSNSVSTLEKPIPRTEEVETKYTEVKAIFNRKIKSKEMNRDEILALENYLQNNVFEYEKKPYKNNAHAIYVMLRAKDITLAHLLEIESFLNS